MEVEEVKFELGELKKGLWLIYGPPGAGKTTAAYRLFPQPLFLDVEDGARFIPGLRRIAIKSLKELKESLGMLASVEYKTLVLDSITRVEDWLFESYENYYRTVAERKAEAAGRKLPLDYQPGREYGRIFVDVRNALENLVRRLQIRSDIVVLIGHSLGMLYDPDKPEARRVGLIGRGKVLVEALADVIGCLYVDLNGERWLDFTPIETAESKSRYPQLNGVRIHPEPEEFAKALRGELEGQPGIPRWSTIEEVGL